jgi:hypothetical protein
MKCREHTAPLFLFLGVSFIIQRGNGYPGDEFFDMGQQGFNETHGIGKAVSETADQVCMAANNSDEQNDQGEQKDCKVKFVISKEMFILIGIAFCKIVLWCLYRSARDEGLDVNNL